MACSRVNLPLPLPCVTHCAMCRMIYNRETEILTTFYNILLFKAAAEDTAIKCVLHGVLHLNQTYRTVTTFYEILYLKFQLQK
jgi:hypothetical protein